MTVSILVVGPIRVTVKPQLATSHTSLPPRVLSHSHSLYSRTYVMDKCP